MAYIIFIIMCSIIANSSNVITGFSWSTYFNLRKLAVFKLELPYSLNIFLSQFCISSHKWTRFPRLQGQTVLSATDILFWTSPKALHTIIFTSLCANQVTAQCYWAAEGQVHWLYFLFLINDFHFHLEHDSLF